MHVWSWTYQASDREKRSTGVTLVVEVFDSPQDLLTWDVIKLTRVRERAGWTLSQPSFSSENFHCLIGWRSLQPFSTGLVRDSTKHPDIEPKDTYNMPTSTTVMTAAQQLIFLCGRLQGLAATNRYELPEPLRDELRDLAKFAGDVKQ